MIIDKETETDYDYENIRHARFKTLLRYKGDPFTQDCSEIITIDTKIDDDRKYVDEGSNGNDVGRYQSTEDTLERRDALTRSKGREERDGGECRKKESKKDGLPRSFEGWNLWKQKQKPVSLAQGCLARWLLAAGCWRAELPGPSMSTCLPLPPPDSRLSLSLFLISLSPLLYVSSSFSFSYFSLSRGFVHLLQGGGRRAHALAAATFILGPCTKPIRSEESFHANSSENAFVVRRSGALVPNSFPRQNRDASTGRK